MEKAIADYKVYLIFFVSMRWKLEIMLVITIQRTETLMEHIVKLRKLM